MAAPHNSLSWLRPLAILAGSALALALLSWAQAVLIPVALAVLLTFLLSPLVALLQRRGMGRVPAVAVVMIVSGSLVVSVGWLVAHQVNSLVDAFPEYEGNIRQRIARFKSAEERGFFDKLEAIVDRYRLEGIDFHALRTRESGRQRFVYIHVLVPDDWTVKHSHDVAERFKADLASVLPGVVTFAHVEPRDDPASYGHAELHPPVPPRHDG